MAELFEFKNERIEVKCLTPLSDKDRKSLEIVCSMVSGGIKLGKLSDLVERTIIRALSEAMMAKGLEMVKKEAMKQTNKEKIPTNPFTRMRL